MKQPFNKILDIFPRKIKYFIKCFSLPKKWVRCILRSDTTCICTGMEFSHILEYT